jgi:glycosyltransferase involved in cell wall biosynthesis
MDRGRYKPAVTVWGDYRDEDIHAPAIRALGVPLYAFSHGFSAAAKLRAFRRLVRQLEPEVIHSYSFYTNFAAYQAAWRTGTVAVGSVRSDFILDKKAIGPWLGSLSARWPRNQIWNSSSAVDSARRSGGLFVPSQLYVVRNGVDLEFFHNTPLGTDRPVRILGVGSLLPCKRWDRMLMLAMELKRRGLDCLIRIAGDGPLRGSLEQQVQDLGVTDRVEFLGHRDDIHALLADAAFLVHTADNEGCPNAVMEAMACGRAVLATDAGDVSLLVQDGKTGFVVPQEDSTTLAEHAVNLIADHDLCRRMGQEGRAKAEREFKLDRLVREMLAAYRAAGWKGN